MPSAEEKRGQLVAAFASGWFGGSIRRYTSQCRRCCKEPVFRLIQGSATGSRKCNSCLGHCDAAAGTSSQDAHAFVGEQIQSVTLPSGAKEGDHWVFHWKVGPGTNSIPKLILEAFTAFVVFHSHSSSRPLVAPSPALHAADCQGAGEAIQEFQEAKGATVSGTPQAAGRRRGTQLFRQAQGGCSPFSTATGTPHAASCRRSTEEHSTDSRAGGSSFAKDTGRTKFTSGNDQNPAPSVFQVMAYIEEVSSLEEAAAAREDYETASHLNALVKQLQEKIAQLCGAASEIYNKKQNAPENSVQDTASRDHQGGAKKDGGGAEGLQMEVEGGVMH
eukprot:1139774-Pelagomonas_calceolata.AAC.2